MSKRIVILVSGNGTNAQAIIDACKSGKIQGKVVAVISNQAKAFALERAKKVNIPALALSHKDYDSRESYDRDLQITIDRYTPDLIVLAGFMRILTEQFVNAYQGKMLNIHPSLLPKYPGLNTHQRALDNADIEHGCSIHFVTAELDGGPIVLKATVEVSALDTVQSLAQKVAEKEWVIYPKVVEWFCDDSLQLVKNCVMLSKQVIPKGGIVYED